MTLAELKGWGEVTPPYNDRWEPRKPRRFVGSKDTTAMLRKPDLRPYIVALAQLKSQKSRPPPKKMREKKGPKLKP